jgi:hypothetical protein
MYMDAIICITLIQHSPYLYSEVDCQADMLNTITLVFGHEEIVQHVCVSTKELKLKLTERHRVGILIHNIYMLIRAPFVLKSSYASCGQSWMVLIEVKLLVDSYKGDPHRYLL